MSLFNKFFGKLMSYGEDNYIDWNKDIKCVKSFKIFRIIGIDNIQPKNIIDQFDLSFCCVSFDGDKFVVKDKRTLNKEGIIRYISFGKILADRITKYKERGFKILNENILKNPEGLYMEYPLITRKKNINNRTSKYYNNPQFSDFKIRISESPKNNEILFAHKIILVEQSEKFQTLFSNTEFAENKVGELVISHKSISIVEIFIKYLYGIYDIPTLQVNDYFEIYQLADEYLVDSLREVCINILGKLIETDFSVILNMSVTLNINKLVTQCLKLINDDKTIIKKNELLAKFLKANPDLLMELLLFDVEEDIPVEEVLDEEGEEDIPVEEVLDEEGEEDIPVEEVLDEEGEEEYLEEDINEEEEVDRESLIYPLSFIHK